MNIVRIDSTIPYLYLSPLTVLHMSAWIFINFPKSNDILFKNSSEPFLAVNSNYIVCFMMIILLWLRCTIRLLRMTMHNAHAHTLDILFLSNHNIHKSSCGRCYWASDHLIERVWSTKTTATWNFMNVVML